MAWETIERGHFGPRVASGPWVTEPCVSLTKNAISMNRVALMALGIDREKFAATPAQNRPRIKVLLDKQNQRLALVLVPPGTENSFTLTHPTYKRANGEKITPSGHTLQVASRKALDSFPTLAGTRFRVYVDQIVDGTAKRPAVIVNLQPSFRVEA